MCCYRGTVDILPKDKGTCIDRTRTVWRMSTKRHLRQMYMNDKTGEKAGSRIVYILYTTKIHYWDIDPHVYAELKCTLCT